MQRQEPGGAPAFFFWGGFNALSFEFRGTAPTPAARPLSISCGRGEWGWKGWRLSMFGGGVLEAKMVDFGFSQKTIFELHSGAMGRKMAR